MASSLGAAYIAGAAEARAFFPHDYRNQSERIQVTQRAASRGCAPGLPQALREQHKRWGMTPAIQRHLDLLAASERAGADAPHQGEGVAVVATGQQVGLFLGPL